MVKMIVSDVDGTLVHAQDTVNADVIRAFEAAANKGVTLVLASGRSLNALKNVLKQLPMVDYVIQANGGIINDMHTGKIIARFGIPTEYARRIYEYTRQEDVLCHAFYEGKTYTETHMLPGYEYFYNKGLITMRGPFETVDDLLHLIESEGLTPEKYAMLTEDQTVRSRLWQKLETVENLDISAAFAFNIELNRSGINKGYALKELAEHIGISLEECMAFGDARNDVEMLQTAGRGIAMEHGMEEAKAASDGLAKGENGVAHVMDESLRLNLKWSEE
ncbi:Cof-type HAD-IIB family hydrolase [Eubacteriales bacterium OttesenSCG-928-N14]|nr:Cof-type HAD-IIB family hydrolase [Eubacteriales bacterium OttesenSCG-928-N14]